MSKKTWTLALVPATAQYSVFEGNRSILSIVKVEDMFSPVIFLSENARLIAAAPDLLEALKKMRDECIGFVPAFADQVDAAINKAEGR